ncbi:MULTISPECIES: hypothetical protein [Paenibacillus]|uniref:Uncharacterized protein n=1 Tax=Paenibacillus silagei TaxID=1670801 RepID=A0ABS4NJW1_9BACL|nr:hypothetical protein [Paenibacillus silagei]MBP2110330.1 hypothetical protein [Paenibacillus silagei]
MQELKKTRKKLYISAAVSACLVLGAVPSAYAGPGSLLDNRIGNELEAEFNVTAVNAEDTVVLSWDSSALKLDKKAYDLTKDTSKEIEYFISPGAENDDNLKVSVLLEIPTAAAGAVELDNRPESFVEGNYTYYYIDKGLEVNVGDAADSNEFDITFKAVSPQNAPFTAKLLAVKEVKPAQKTTFSGNLQEPNPYQHRDMIMYLSSAPATAASTGTFVINIGEMTPNFSDGQYDGFLYTDKKGIPLLAEYYDAAAHTFTIPVELAAGDSLEVFRLNYPTYSLTPNSQMTAKFDQDGEETVYTFSDEVKVTYNTTMIP